MGGVRSKCLSPESPLDNDMLLEIIFKYLRSAELVRSRLVSKRWEECATKVLRKRRDLVISLDCKTIGEFTSSMENSRKPPFLCYRLKCVYYGDESFRKFTQVCGDSVKTLRFDLRASEDRKNTKTPGCSSCLEPLQKKQLPVENDLIHNVILKLGSTLEVLKFWTMPFSNPEASIEVKVTFQSNLKIVRLLFPNPGDLMEVACVCKELAEFVSRVFSLSRNLAINSNNNEIALLKDCGILDLVTFLSIDNCTQVFGLELLDSNIVLKEFCACNGPDTSSLHLFQSFLKMQRKQLKVLTLTVDHFNFIWRKGLKLPVMSELTQLKMFEVVEENYKQFLTLGGLDLLCNLPKLRSLSFHSSGALHQGNELESIFSNNLPIFPFTSLESLFIHLVDESLVVSSLPYFGKRFPNITDLILIATSKILRTLFGVADWGLNLKELKILFVETTGDIFNESRDCGICGFTSEWRRGVGMKLLMNKNQGAILREAEAWNRGPVGSGGITKFPNLEHLSFRECCRSYKWEKKKYFISDLSIYFALVNLKSLRSLWIFGNYKITPEALKYLKANCPVLRSVVIS